MPLTDMSFREKSAWTMAILLGLTGLLYAWDTAERWISLGAAPPPSIAVAFAYLVLLIAGSIITQSLLGVSSPKEANAPADEREKLAELKASHWSGWIISIAAIWGVIHYYTQRDGNYFFHIVVGGLMVAQVAEYVLQIIYFRRGA